MKMADRERGVLFAEIIFPDVSGVDTGPDDGWQTLGFTEGS